MATPVNFVGSNLLFKAPAGRDDIGDLPTFSNGVSVVSAWQLSDTELDEVARTGVVYLSVQCGRNFFPAFVGGENEVRSVVVDTGPVWQR